MRLVVIFLLICANPFGNAISQEQYNNCNNALEICPGEFYSVNNLGANVTFCADCEDDFNYCFSTDNTIWLTFTTNDTGGDVQVDFSNLVFENSAGQDTELQATMLQAVVPCDAATYTAIGNCVSNATGNFTLSATGLPANTTYYVVIDGDNTGAGITSPAECTLNAILSGTGVDRPVPSLNLTQSTATPCLNEVVTFITSPVDCPDNGDFEWYVNGVLVAVTTDSTFQSSELQTGDVVTVKTSCYTVCVDSVSNSYVPMNVYSFPIDAGPDVTIEEGEAIMLNGSTTAPVYQWTPGFYLSADNVLNPVATPDQTVTYTLTAIQNGCTLFDYVTVSVNSGLSIPNTFSPNGDDLNETWVIKGIEKYPNCLMEIYSRWGQKIFQSSGYSEQKAWDGTVKSGDIAEGVYYYILELRDGSGVIIKGSVTVLR